MRRIITVAVVGLLTACGSSDGQTSGSGRASSSPSAPATGPAEADRVTPLGQRLQARITVPPGDGDDVEEVGGSIWVKMENGFVVRVDPRTNKVVGRIRLDEPGLDFRRHCQGLGTDGESLWTCAMNAKTAPIVRIDPATGKVVEKFAVDKHYDQLWLPYASGRIWVLTNAGHTLTGLRPGGDVKNLQLELVGAQVTGSGGALLVTSTLDDTVSRIDAETGKLLNKATVSRPTAVSATKSDAWVATTEGLVRMDAETLAPKTTYKILSGQNADDVLATDDEVWVRVKGKFLYRIDPRSGAITDQITADPLLSGGSVLLTDGSVWTTAYDNRLLLRVSR